MEEFKEKIFEKSQELIDAALKEFGENGYENASLNNILKEAGISKGTFYYHFENKEDLYFYLISTFAEEKKKFLAKKITQDIFQNNLFDLIEKLIELGLEFSQQNPKISKFSETYTREHNTEIIRKINERYGEQSNAFMDVFIENAYSKGELRNDLPLDFQKRMITYLITHLIEISNIMDINDFKNAATNLIQFIRYGLENREH